MSTYPTTIPALSPGHHAALSQYSACDISDALLALKTPHAGFLPDITRVTSPNPSVAASAPLIGPASTVLFVPKLAPSDLTAYTSRHALPRAPNLPPGAHWVDCVARDTVVVLAQPEAQRNAVLGGIMAARMHVLRVRGAVVAGRVRDLAELTAVGLPIFAKGTSTVGAGLASAPYAINVPIVVEGVGITPGDIVFADPENGVVVIPRALLEKVLEILPGLVEADRRAVEDVKAGVSVSEAFRRHRGK